MSRNRDPLIVDMYNSVKRIEREIQEIEKKLDNIEHGIGNIERDGKPPPESYV